MGESAACLRRSISYPSKELREGDPLRALTDSISFGRFMQESLAWEKWSAFAHNRRLEEVENLSKPGSVAQKKAYFEAYYNKKAAVKAAAEVKEAATYEATQSESADESQSSCPTSFPREIVNSNKAIDKDSERVASTADMGHFADSKATQLESTHEIQSSFPASFPKEFVNSSEVIDKDSERIAFAADMGRSADTSRGDSSFENSSITQRSCSTDLQKENVTHHAALDEREEMYTSSADTSAVDSRFDKRSSVIQGSCSTGLHNENANSLLVIDKQEEKDASAVDGAYSSDASDVNSSLDQNCTVFIPAEEKKGTMVQRNHTKDTNDLVKDLEKHGNNKDQEKYITMQGHKLPAEKTVVHEITASGSNKDQASSKPLSRARASKIPLPPTKCMTYRKSNNVAPVEKKSIRKPADTKKSMNSLHMSINLSSGAAHKPSTSVFRPIENTKVHTTMQKSKDSSSRLRSLTTTSVSGMLKPPLITPGSEERRSRRLLSNSISGLTMNPKIQTLHAEIPNIPAASGRKARSSFLSCPFTFRTEERAAKRKEKLEGKTKGTENMQTRFKDKVEHEPETLRRGTRFKPKPIEELDNGTPSSIQQMKKIPVPPPQPPKPERKKIASKVQEESLRPPQRTSNPKDSSRHLLRRHTHKTACSVTSLPKKTTHENASPYLES